MSENESNPQRPSRFDLLAQKFLEQALEPGEAGELLAMIENEPEAGTDLLDQLAVHELLAEAARAERVTSLASPFGRGTKRGSWWPGIAAAAAALAMAALVLVFVRSPQDMVVSTPQPVPASAELTSFAVAVLGQSVGAEWETESVAPMAESPLEPGILKLRSGLVRIDFFNGARVVLTGPAVIELIAKDRAICHSGKLTAEVPPQARGFVIGTPDGDIRDLGTEFGVEVGEGGASVHVFNGEVEIEDNGPQKFFEGEGVRLVKGRTTERFASDPTAFTLLEDALEGQRDLVARRSRAWAEAGKTWNADLGLLARFDFEGLEAPAFRLRNTAKRPGVEDGAIIGSPLVEGRWPGKGALQFRSLSDRVRLDIPGEFESLSFTTWVSVQSLPHRHNSLLMTDGFDPGEVHWQIRQNGTVRLGIRAGDNSQFNTDSPPLVTPAMFGQWIHLAVVIDGASKTVTHYFNGEPVANFGDLKLPPLRLGAACIGNWSEPISETVIRNFNGAMDEMTIHDRPLTADEIGKMFAVGSPW